MADFLTWRKGKDVENCVPSFAGHRCHGCEIIANWVSGSVHGDKKVGRLNHHHHHQ